MKSNTLTLSKTDIQNQTASQLHTAGRAAGLLYLAIIICGIFAEFFVRSNLIISGDPIATAANITASETLFRAGIVSDLVMILSDVAIGLAFYVLLKPVSNALALLAAFFRLAQAAALGLNLLNLFFGLKLITGADYLAGFDPDQLYALGLMFLEAHGLGYSIALVFFGLSLLILGYLIFKSGYFPKILGILLVIASLGYLVESSAKFLLPSYEVYRAFFDQVVIGPAFLAEFSLCLWLLIKGVSLPETDK